VGLVSIGGVAERPLFIGDGGGGERWGERTRLKGGGELGPRRGERERERRRKGRLSPLGPMFGGGGDCFREDGL
jgi:hypothetical protein